MSAFETLEDAAQIYNVDLGQLIEELHLTISPAGASPAAEKTTANGEGEQENDQPKTNFDEEQPMTAPYTFFEDINAAIDNIPTESIVSRTVYRDDQLKSIVFAFAPGQELSEHTASVPAIIQILEGECELTLGDDSYTVKAGAWARMPANLPHSILAHTPVKMLLLMLT